jgi:hypothetical protein
MDKLSNKELIDLCKERGVKGYSGKKKTELIGLSDESSQVIWTRNFLTEQGYSLPPATIFQDNKSTMALVDKGRSTCARTRHINVRYFFIKDRVEKKDIEIECLPTGKMTADILTKPHQVDSSSSYSS